MTDIAVDQQQEPASSISRPVTATAALAALGIDGDLGTSPLYTLTAIMDSVGGNSLPRSGWGSCR
jgi:K+ transporter